MYYINHGGKNHGPYSIPALQTLFAAGEIPAEALYWNEEQGTWRPIGELASSSPPPPPPPEPAPAPVYPSAPSSPPAPPAQPRYARIAPVDDSPSSGSRTAWPGHLWLGAGVILLFLVVLVTGIVYSARKHAHKADPAPSASTSTPAAVATGTGTTVVTHTSAPPPASTPASTPPWLAAPGVKRTPPPDPDSDEAIVSDRDYIAMVNAIEKSKFDAAVAFAKALVSRHPRSSMACKALARAYYWSDSMEKARAALNQALVFKPDDDTTWDDLGILEALLDKPADAEQSFEKALALRVDNPKARIDMAAWIYIPQKRIAAAEAALSTARRQLLTNEFNTRSGQLDEVDVWVLLGETYRDFDRVDDAVTSLRKAIDLSPKSVTAWNSLGRIYLDFQRNTDAIDAYAQATEINAYSGSAWYGLGCGYLREKRPIDAANALKKAVAIDPEDGHAWYSLAGAYYDMGRNDDAISAASSAAVLMPARPDIWVFLGKAYDAAGKPTDANLARQRARDLDAKQNSKRTP